MGWWKADAPVEPASPSAPSTPLPSASDNQASCPVDPKTRAIWLLVQQDSKAQHPRSAPGQPIPTVTPDNTRAPMTASISGPTARCSSDAIDQSSTPQERFSGSNPASTRTRSLSHDRVISSIPRASATQPSPPSPRHSSIPSNSETETDPHPSGHWIYPSEHQFFTAVLRKHDPQTFSPFSSSSSPSATDTLAHTVPSIIPIHNAVNERAWALIQRWERPFSPPNPTPTRPGIAVPCTGPKLLSFRGLGSGPPTSPPESGYRGLVSDYVALLNPTTGLSPKARWNALLGYQVPFDRHDWVVQRCGGETVEYVIDFYQGRSAGGSAHAGRERRQDEEEGGGGGGEGRPRTLNFYLDVRPKLNSWEGWKTRATGLGVGIWGSDRGNAD